MTELPPLALHVPCAVALLLLQAFASCLKCNPIFFTWGRKQPGGSCGRSRTIPARRGNGGTGQLQ